MGYRSSSELTDTGLNGAIPGPRTPQSDLAEVRPQPRARPPGRREHSLLRRTGAWKDALRRRMLLAADLAAIAFGVVAVALLADVHGSVVIVAATAPLWLVMAKVCGSTTLTTSVCSISPATSCRASIYWSVLCCRRRRPRW